MKYMDLTLSTCIAASSTVAVGAFTITPLVTSTLASNRRGSVHSRTIYNAKKDKDTDEDDDESNSDSDNVQQQYHSEISHFDPKKQMPVEQTTVV